MTGIGGALVTGGSVLMAVTGEYAGTALLVTAGVAAAASGGRLWRVPSGGARLSVDAEAIRCERRGTTIVLPWTEVDRWGVASRRAFGATSRFTQLLVWPAESVSEATRAAARPLWHADRGVWALTTYDPPAELVAAFDRAAPQQRRDALAESDW